MQNKLLSVEPCIAFTDANQLEDAVLNLALNARDAMPDGERLTIQTANERLEIANSVLDDEIPTGDYVVVSVADTGSGMSPDVIDKAFDPFFTTKPIGQGTGLGLSMICGFVKQSGGHVRINSELGRGTTVSIYLRSADSAAEQTSPIGKVQPKGRGETVLIVEDDSAVRFTVTELLKELGYFCMAT
jgi:signal transduction histidine kinase